MEEEARIRLAQEGHLNLAANQDEESVRLMKQALLLEKILANYDDSCERARTSSLLHEQTPSKAI